MEAGKDANSEKGYNTKVVAYASVEFVSSKGKGSATNNFFKSAQWSPDGTCLISNSADNHIRTFIVPPDLLEDRNGALELSVYSSIPSFEAVNALICYPGFDLQNPSAALILSTATEHPLRLNNALDGRLVASYPLASPTTEAYIKPHSLLFDHDGHHFIAGSNSLISFFDVSRVGESPAASIKTGPKNSRSRWDNPGTALSGLISALALDPQYNVLTAATLSRQIGLYDAGGKGECVGAFSLVGTQADSDVSGGGITQVIWSKCGRYLYVAERKSDGCLVYDIRKTGQLLSWTTGRRALTNQRMSVDLQYGQDWNTANLWAGGTDGSVRCWSEPASREGAVGPSYELDAHEGIYMDANVQRNLLTYIDVVNSTSIHPVASVVASASGQRHLTFSPTEEDVLGNSRDRRDMLTLTKLVMPSSGISCNPASELKVGELH